MARHGRFQPMLDRPLEPRTLLSGFADVSTTGSLGVIDPAQISGTGNSALANSIPTTLIGSLSRGIQRKDGAPFRLLDAIDRAFDNFNSDYLQAQSAYFNTPSSSKGARATFLSVSRQRVNLLSQQLVQVFVRIPGSIKRTHGSSVLPVQAFLQRRILSTNPQSQSLYDVLRSEATPDSPEIGQAQSALYTLVASNAIETARVATVNAAKLAASGAFRKR